MHPAILMNTRNKGVKIRGLKVNGCTLQRFLVACFQSVQVPAGLHLSDHRVGQVGRPAGVLWHFTVVTQLGADNTTKQGHIIMPPLD